MRVFFTADQHFGHEKIIEHTVRQYSDVNEMNEAMVLAWNNVVKPKDLVYHLGDFIWGNPDEAMYWIGQLNGNIYSMMGNHDMRWWKQVETLYPTRTGVLSYQRDIVHLSKKGRKTRQTITMCHYPLMSWPGRLKGSWHLYGHVHGAFARTSKTMDVGVDTKLMDGKPPEPYSFDEIKHLLVV